MLCVKDFKCVCECLRAFAERIGFIALIEYESRWPELAEFAEAIWREHADDIERLCDEYAVEVGARDADEFVLEQRGHRRPVDYVAIAIRYLGRDALKEV